MAESIDQVITRMDRRLDQAVATNDPRGHFAAVYRAVTARVRDGIEAGEFIDNDRMERFDVIFANFYLDAAEAYDAGRPLSASWRTTFDYATSPLLVLQHVLMGMNAHINLDLGVAAAHTLPGEQIIELEDDFERINDVLAEMIDRMQEAVAAVSPWTGLVDRVGGRLDEMVTNWSLEYARHRSWRFAQELARAGGDDSLVLARDRAVAGVNEVIACPRRATRWAIAAARRREHADVATIVAALRDRGAPVPAV